jgi:hypothetical protein
MLKMSGHWMMVLLTASAVFMLASRVCAQQTASLPAVMDNSIVMVDGEWDQNAGQQGRIRIKGNQHIVAMAFDMSAVAGRRISKATLVCTQGEQRISGISISTIAPPWDENRSTGLTAGIEGTDGWGYKGARFPAVSGGNSFTLVSQATSAIRDGQYHWDVPPDMVHAMAVGVAHGLAIHEHDADYGRNPTIFAHEQAGRKPHLLVEFDARPEPAPEPATNLRIISVDSTSARLTLTSPGNGFAYEITLNDRPLGRHNIPLIEKGKQQIILLRDLPASVVAEQACEIQVVTVNRTGERSKAAVLRGVVNSSAAVEKPSIASPPATSPAIPGLFVIPVLDKFDSTGQPVGELPEGYRTNNSIFNGQRIRLTGAAGEVLGFQLLLRSQRDASVSVNVELDEPAIRIDLQQAVYVPANGRMIPDPLLPMPESVALKPDTDEAIVADIFLPFDASPGVRRGKINLSDGRVVPIEIEILPFALPRGATFFCEMNGYGLPDHVDEYYALQQIAYDHRVHANILHYSHNTAAPGSRKSNLDMRLRSGRRMDNKRYDDIQPDAASGYWDDFAEAFGPYLDGSLFKNGHRGPVAAPGFYLTFHESWPLNCRAYFDGNPDAYEAFSAKPEYARTYVNVLQDFARLAESKGWRKTGFQVYFNNKGSMNEKTKAPWILDEPSGFWDYRALQFYGELTDRGRAVAPQVTIDYRIDISRPEYCRGQLSQRNDLWIVSSWAFQHYRRLVTDRLELDGLKAWVYGTSNHVHETNRNIQAWVLDTWQDGGTGIVPWQTVDKSGNALKEADQLGLFIFDKDSGGKTVIRHSMRLKAYRDAQQLIEYLNLLQQQRNWSQDQMRRFVRQYAGLNAQVSKINEADAGTTGFGSLSASELETLRMATVQLLQAK